MGMFSHFMVHQNWLFLLTLVLGIVPCAMISIIFSKVCCKMAYHLGDPNPKINGRDSWHPLVQLDPVGFLLFATTGVGWGKALPLKTDHFTKPKWHSLLVLWAGMGVCLLISLISMVIASVFWLCASENPYCPYIVWCCLQWAVLSCSFALSQCLPCPDFGLFQVLSWGFGEKHQKFTQKYQGHLTLCCGVILWSGLWRNWGVGMVSFVLSPLCGVIPLSVLQQYFL